MKDSGRKPRMRDGYTVLLLGASRCWETCTMAIAEGNFKEKKRPDKPGASQLREGYCTLMVMDAVVRP